MASLSEKEVLERAAATAKAESVRYARAFITPELMGDEDTATRLAAVLQHQDCLGVEQFLQVAPKVNIERHKAALKESDVKELVDAWVPADSAYFSTGDGKWVTTKAYAAPPRPPLRSPLGPDHVPASYGGALCPLTLPHACYLAGTGPGVGEWKLCSPDEGGCGGYSCELCHVARPPPHRGCSNHSLCGWRPSPELCCPCDLGDPVNLFSASTSFLPPLPCLTGGSPPCSPSPPRYVRCCPS